LSVVTTFVRRRGAAVQEELEGWVFALPFILGFFMWTVFPMGFSALMSFAKWDIVTPWNWRGLGNYEKLIFGDNLFWISLKNTFFLTFIGVPINLIAALLAAFGLNVETRVTNLYRTLYFLPSQIPTVANAVLWALMFNYESGVVNAFLRVLGLEPVNWLYNIDTAKPALIFMGLWGIGGNMMIFLAGLQGIPEELYEAAQIDGAGIFRRLVHITLPLLSPVIFFNLVMGIIGSLQGGFATVYVMTGGGPANATLITMLYLYRQAFFYMHMGYASAFAWILFLIIMGFTAIQFAMAKRWVFYEAG